MVRCSSEAKSKSDVNHVNFSLIRDNRNQRSDKSEDKKPNQPTVDKADSSKAETAGPGAMPDKRPESPEKEGSVNDVQTTFKFAPTMNPLLYPSSDLLPEGCDAWAFAKGYTSVTPLKAVFSGIEVGGFGNAEGEDWKAGTLWEDGAPQKSSM
jgi:hypothetical protein